MCFLGTTGMFPLTKCRRMNTVLFLKHMPDINDASKCVKMVRGFCFGRRLYISGIDESNKVSYRA